MTDWLSWIGALGGIAGMISLIDLLADIRHNRFLAVHEYLKGFEDPAFIAAREAVYNHTGDPCVKDKNMAMVVNYYHHWGILAKNKYLPLWVFDEGSGAGTMRLYKKTKDFIDLRRKENNDDTYAAGFVWLVQTLEKRKRKSS